MRNEKTQPRGRPTRAEIDLEWQRLALLHADYVDLLAVDLPLDPSLYPEILELDAAMAALMWALGEPACEPPSALIGGPLRAGDVERPVTRTP